MPSNSIQEWLSESGLDDIPSNYREATSQDLLLFPGSKKPAVVIEYLGLDGKAIMEDGVVYRRLRLLSKSDARYLSMPGFGSHVYVSTYFASCVQDGKLEYLVITEGEKKADKACLSGIPTIAIPGITMWADDIHRAQEKEKYMKEHPDAESGPPLSFQTPVHREILNIIKAYNVKKVVVLMDSDGYPMDLSALPLHMKDQVYPVHYLGRKCGVLNRDVWRQCGLLAQALSFQTTAKVYHTFCPPYVELHEVDKKRQVVKDPNAGKVIRKNGLDDWIVRDGHDTVYHHILSFMKSSKPMVPPKVHEHKNLGYIPVGIRNGTHLVVWNEQTQSLHIEAIKSITTAAAIINMVGSDTAIKRWGKVHPETEEVSIKVVQALRDIEKECSSMGVWDHESNEIGAGVWEIDNTLVINGKKEVCAIHDDEVQVLPRCELGRKIIYTSRPKAPEIFKEGIHVDDFRRVLSNVESWNWTNPVEPFLYVGWLLMQSYLGCLDKRPHMFITGESGSGKSSLLDFSADFLADICFYVPDGSQTSSAGLKQKLKSDALTLILDELEPGNGLSHEGKKRQEALISIMRLLRSAYNISSSTGDKAERIGSIKGSASGESVEYSTKTSVLMAGIAVSDLEQADANRMLILHLKPVDKANRLVEIDNIHIIGRKARWTMWTNWHKFQHNLSVVHQYIVRSFHIDQRLGWTLGTPIAASITMLQVLGLMEDTDDKARGVAHKIVSEYSGITGTDVTPDHVKLLDKLLSLAIPVECKVITDNGEHVSRENATIFEILKEELTEGVTKDTWIGGCGGRALHQRGMTAKVVFQNGIPHYELFIASKHSGIDYIAKRLGVPSLYNMMTRIDNSYTAVARVDGGRQVRGVWVPIDNFMLDIEVRAFQPEYEKPEGLHVTH